MRFILPFPVASSFLIVQSLRSVNLGFVHYSSFVNLLLKLRISFLRNMKLIQDVCEIDNKQLMRALFSTIVLTCHLPRQSQHKEAVQKSQSKSHCSDKNSIFNEFEQRNHIANSFITSLFFYCLLVQMFHSRRLNNHINHIHERTLTIIYQGYNSSFKELLRKDNS